MSTAGQGEFQFSSTGMPAGVGGLDSWRAERRAALHALAEKLGLPLGRRVEVRLSDGVILQGELRLPEEVLFLDQVDARNIELAVGRATFRHSDIEACVTLE